MPTYNGKMDANIVIDWIEYLENYFECEETPKIQKVKITKSKLRGATITWVEFCPRRKGQGRKEYDCFLEEKYLQSKGDMCA